MIWWYTSTRHESSIGSFARTWIGGSLLDRLVIASMYGSVTIVVAMGLGLLSRSPEAFVFFFLAGTTPWWFWVYDTIIDHYHVRGDLAKYLAQDDVVLATRCEYIGGHPELPHGRFAYLLLEGSRQNPNLTLGFPAPPGQPMIFFSMPVLDLTKTKADTEEAPSIAAAMISGINEKAGGLLKSEQVTLSVDYQGAAGRRQKVELTHFFGGGGEVRNWRNYLICAQAEADTGKRPFGPWKSLKDTPAAIEVIEEVTGVGGSRNGHEVRKPSSAFARR
ncbi:MAG: hypothetical protein WEC75_09670 [Dehalococcoidia bacterium]